MSNVPADQAPGPVGRPFVKGFDARRTGGKPGRSGRPSNDVRAICARDLERPRVRKAVIAVIENPDHAHFAAVLKTLMAYAHGTPKQTMEFTAELPPLRIVRDTAAVKAEMAERRGDE